MKIQSLLSLSFCLLTAPAAIAPEIGAAAMTAATRAFFTAAMRLKTGVYSRVAPAQCLEQQPQKKHECVGLQLGYSKGARGASRRSQRTPCSTSWE